MGACVWETVTVFDVCKNPHALPHRGHVGGLAAGMALTALLGPFYWPPEAKYFEVFKAKIAGDVSLLAHLRRKDEPKVFWLSE